MRKRHDSTEKEHLPRDGVFVLCEFSFSFENVALGGTTGVTGSTFFNGACLLPGAANDTVLSGELYIPNTSAKASFVLIVTVGSPASTLFLPRVFSRDVLGPSSLRSTKADEEDEEEAGDDVGEGDSEGGGGPHFFPRRPIERALAS